LKATKSVFVITFIVGRVLVLQSWTFPTLATGLDMLLASNYC